MQGRADQPDNPAIVTGGISNEPPLDTYDCFEIWTTPRQASIHMFSIRGYDSGPRFAAPALGQHNEKVLKEILGMSEDEITEPIIAGALE